VTASTDRYVPVSHLQGDSKLVRIDFFADLAATIPRDMSGYDFTAQVRRRPGASGVIADLDVDTSNAAGGIVVFELPAAKSAAITPGTYRWDGQMVLAGRVLTFAAGDWVVEGQVTR
jgi:hypothetical protein